MPLTDTRIRNLKAGEKPQKFSDGGGLHVLVTPLGSKLWRMAYRFDGKQKTLAFGAYPIISLQDARERRDTAKRMLASGEDPSQIARAEKIERKVLSANTFNAIADEMLTKLEREGRSAATMKKKRWLLDMVRGAFGERPITSISAAEILGPLRQVEAKGIHGCRVTLLPSARVPAFAWRNRKGMLQITSGVASMGTKSGPRRRGHAHAELRQGYSRTAA